MEAQSLKNKRKAIKASLTKFGKYLDTVTVARSELHKLKLRLQMMENLWQKYDDIQFRLEELEPDDVDRDTFEENYYEIVARGRELVHKIEEGNADRLSTSSTNLSNGCAKAKLPVLTLPKFDGDYTKWLQFKDSFTSAIHNNDALSSIDKFRYLRSSLQGDALQLIGELQTTSDNYTVAWSTLEERYHNERLIVHTHVKSLFELQVTGKSNHVNLRQVIDKYQMHMRALQALNESIESDAIAIYLLVSKFDVRIRSEWEHEIGVNFKKTKPKLKDLLDFLSNKCQILEMTEGIVKTEPGKSSIVKKSYTMNAVTYNCPNCNDSHPIYRCEKLLKLNASDRLAKIKDLQLCMNCLKSGHYIRDCISKSTCKKCNKKHNTILHTSRSNDKQNASMGKNLEEHQDSSQSSTIITSHFTQQKGYEIILCTAMVQVIDKDGKIHLARALLDSGSQSSFITRKLTDQLKIPHRKIEIPVHGINNSHSMISRAIEVKVKSTINSFNTSLDCLILNRITETLPQIQINRNKLNIPDNIKLADPQFHQPREIDLLIGADHFWSLLCIGKIELGKDKPILQNTLFGWIVSGPMFTDHRDNNNSIQSYHCLKSARDNMLEKFWQIEELGSKRPLSIDEKQCEEIFINTVRRDSSGRFIVGLPQRIEINLGESVSNAQRRFHWLEKRLDKDTELKKQYVQFMREYERLNHMSKIPLNDIATQKNSFFLPHHAVVREDKLTTKLRVVFDGSCKTSNGYSLNDRLLTGYNVQEDLLNIILRFRTHQYVLTADIAMMYRQILVRPEDRHLQQICWREEKDGQMQYYTLNTVTYGTSAAPFLATRVLKQLAFEDGSKYPLASKALENDFYMDDVLTGCSTIEDAIQLQKQLSDLLAAGGFALRKWRSNHEDIFKHLQAEAKAENMLIIDKQEKVKTLGLLWDAQADTINYQVHVPVSRKVTKRNILSTIATIFDPLGLVGPVIIIAKRIVQKLWQINKDWDDEVPLSIHTSWVNYSGTLQQLNRFSIPRNINPGNIETSIDIHGFCDASEMAYGGCLYASSKNLKGEITTQLLCAKSRVAPLKTLTLPRLELCGALILARLLDTAKTSLKDKVRKIHLWSDSTIVLSWIKTEPNQLKTFVANRVSLIQSLTFGASWKHVNSADNPADIISRGMTTDQLIKCDLWWKGPSWLLHEQWPTHETAEKFNTTLEHKSKISLLIVQEQLKVLNRFSSFAKLQRVIAYCNRFIHNLSTHESKQYGELSTQELEKAAQSIVLLVQREGFAREIEDLTKTGIVNKKSPLRNLNPFLDNGLIRVGGRLTKANLDIDQKHPQVLPKNHHVTNLLIRQEHEKLLHAGQEQVLSSIRARYWPLSGRRNVKKIILGCMKCFRFRPTLNEHMMGALPKARVTETNRPFVITGVDFAGPLQLKEHNRRGRPLIRKAYVAVFVCFSTKAIHLELVSDLTTDSFLATLKRFTSRRGLCQQLYSDNAKGFVGANAKLKEFYQFLVKAETEIKSELTKRKIEWHFIPPRGPHFGGLWEAAVKSMKSQLMKVTQGLILTFEECATLLSEIEAVLNSRPITPLSADPNDLQPLTPAHFLIGDSLLEPATRCYLQEHDNRLSRWEHLQKVKQHFWQRWQKEYLGQHQVRQKWTEHHPNIKVGDMVMLMEDSIHPLKWSTGRVMNTHPGEDGVVRVVTVKTVSGTVKRPVRKVAVLPYIK